MRNKRILVLAAAVGLLAMLATTAYAASSHRPATPAIAGVWQTTIDIEALPEKGTGFWTFYGDGSFLDVNSWRETNPGNWMGSGSTYVLTFWGFLFDEQGQTNGRGEVRLAIKMTDADHFTGEGVTLTFDLEGNPMENQFEGPFTVEGVRMHMALP
jgi:hypothetical protein